MLKSDLFLCDWEESQPAGTATVPHQVTSNWDTMSLTQRPQAAFQRKQESSAQPGHWQWQVFSSCHQESPVVKQQHFIWLVVFIFDYAVPWTCSTASTKHSQVMATETAFTSWRESKKRAIVICVCWWTASFWFMNYPHIKIQKS